MMLLENIMKHTADVVAGTTTLTSLGITTMVTSLRVILLRVFSVMVQLEHHLLLIRGDTDTGLYFSGADEISLTTGGTQRLSVNSSGHLNHNGSASADISALTSCKFCCS